MGISGNARSCERGLRAHCTGYSFARYGRELSDAGSRRNIWKVVEIPSLRRSQRRVNAGPLQSLLQGATPEEHARLEEERKRISAAARAFGTDPTAINGYYQLELWE